jgi:hypothetical protein
MDKEIKPLIIALGGAGIEIVSKYAEKHAYPHCVFIDTDPSMLKHNRGVPKIYLAIEQFCGEIKTLPELMLQQKKKLWNVVCAYPKIILVTGLGGYTGTQLVRLLYDWLKTDNKETFLLATSPAIKESLMHYRTGTQAAAKVKTEVPEASRYIFDINTLTEMFTDANLWHYYDVAFSYMEDQLSFIIRNGKRLNVIDLKLDDSELKELLHAIMTTETSNSIVLSNLLTGLAAINRKYLEIARTTGENFNVFRVLKIDTDEVRMHSALIGELLNPKGTHGQGDIFLRLFIQQFNLAAGDERRITVFNSTDALVEVEKYIGLKTEATGGRIDLLITDKQGNCIIIENKIYAADQENQLTRYTNFNSSAHLCYLTLNGNEPSEQSILNNREKVVCLSYKIHIVEWLEACLKEAVKFPLLRETITQYLHLIKHLTNQSINYLMEQEEIQLILKDKDNLEMAIKIAQSGDLIKRKVIEEFVKSVIDTPLPNGFNLIDYSRENMGYPETNMRFGKSADARFFIAIEFTNYNHLDIGVCVKRGEKATAEESDKIFNKLDQYRVGGKKSDSWPWYVKFEEWDKSSWWDVCNGSFKNSLYKAIDEIGRILPEHFSK